eukprot:975104_1
MAGFTFVVMASALYSASSVELYMTTMVEQIVSYDIDTNWIYAYSVNTSNYDISGGLSFVMIHIMRLMIALILTITNPAYFHFSHLDCTTIHSHHIR